MKWAWCTRAVMFTEINWRLGTYRDLPFCQQELTLRSSKSIRKLLIFETNVLSSLSPQMSIKYLGPKCQRRTEEAVPHTHLPVDGRHTSSAGRGQWPAVWRDLERTATGQHRKPSSLFPKVLFWTTWSTAQRGCSQRRGGETSNL